MCGDVCVDHRELCFINHFLLHLMIAESSCSWLSLAMLLGIYCLLIIESLHSENLQFRRYCLFLYHHVEEEDCMYPF